MTVNVLLNPNRLIIPQYSCLFRPFESELHSIINHEAAIAPTLSQAYCDKDDGRLQRLREKQQCTTVWRQRTSAWEETSDSEGFPANSINCPAAINQDGERALTRTQ